MKPVKSPRLPYPWQAEACQFLLDGGSCLALDPGLGKSFAALLADKDLAYFKHPMLIACPPVAIGVWQSEIKMVWDDARVHVLTSDKPIPTEPFDFCLVSIDLPARNNNVAHQIETHLWRRLIIDEAHKCKTFDSARTKFWLTGRDAIAHIVGVTWLLTGTPAPNGRCSEVYSLVDATQPERLSRFTGRTPAKAYEAFCEYYMDYKVIMIGGSPKRQIKGNNAARMKDFAETIKGWMLRIKKTDAGLPAKIRRVIPLAVADLKLYDDFLHTDEGYQLAQAIQRGDPDLLQHFDGSLSRMRKLLSKSKVPAVMDWLMEAIDAGDHKIVCFAWHTETIAELEKLLKAAGVMTVKVTGANSQADRTKAVALFQNHLGPIVFLGNIAAAGVAVTLTASRRVVFAEASWVPGDNMQAEDRCHRIGQTGTVVIDYLTASDTLDTALLGSVARKIADVEAIGA